MDESQITLLPDGFAFKSSYRFAWFGEPTTCSAFQNQVLKGRVSESTIKELLTEIGAYSQGDHLLLHSGFHTDEYYQLAVAFQDSWFGLLTAYYLWAKVEGYFKADVDLFSFVATPAVGGIPLGDYLAVVANLMSIYVEKSKDGSLVLRRERGFGIPDSTGVVGDDVTTTGDSIVKTIEAVEKGAGHISCALVVINRSGGEQISAIKPHLISMITTTSRVYDPGPETCSGCRENLPLIRPGSE